MSTPVSVLMVVHNGERFLAEAIDSVLAQTFPEFELVIVDDGSTDKTPEILTEYGRRDSRIRISRQKQQGVAEARNQALALAKYEWIAWLDADDRMLPNRLERQLAFIAEHPGASVACSHGYLTNVDNRRIGVSQNEINVERGVAERNPSLFLDVIQSTVLARKQDLLDLGGYRKEIGYAEDRELWGRIVTSGKKLLCQPEKLIEYRLHGSAMTMKKALKTRTLVRFIDTNIVRRLNGEPEWTHEEYLAWRRSRPVWQRLDDERKFFAMFNYKRAVRLYSERALLACAAYCAVAVALRPRYMLNRVRTKLG